MEKLLTFASPLIAGIAGSLVTLGITKEESDIYLYIGITLIVCCVLAFYLAVEYSRVVSRINFLCEELVELKAFVVEQKVNRDTIRFNKEAQAPRGFLSIPSLRMIIEILPDEKELHVEIERVVSYFKSVNKDLAVSHLTNNPLTFLPNVDGGETMKKHLQIIDLIEIEIKVRSDELNKLKGKYILKAFPIKKENSG